MSTKNFAPITDLQLEEYERELEASIEPDVLNSLKQRAAEKGIRYQTLLTTLVHQYLEGQIEVKL